MKNNYKSLIDTQYWTPCDNVIVIYADNLIIRCIENEVVDGYCKPTHKVIVIHSDKHFIKYLETEIVEGRL